MTAFLSFRINVSLNMPKQQEHEESAPCLHAGSGVIIATRTISISDAPEKWI
jgi:hypothetical protein